MFVSQALGSEIGRAVLDEEPCPGWSNESAHVSPAPTETRARLAVERVVRTCASLVDALRLASGFVA